MFATRVVIIAAIGAVVAAMGCASQAPVEAESDPALGETSEAVTLPSSICGQRPLASIDSIPAYRNDCGGHPIFSNNGENTRTTGGSGWIATEQAAAGYQCVELAIRYSYFKFDVSPHWGIQVAADMCTHHPSNVTRTSSPEHGDLMVFAPNRCVGSAGHVAVINSVSSSHASVVQENEYPASATYARSCASCFLHASRNNDCGNAGNSSYCGDTTAFKPGKKGTLYTCQSHAVHSKTVCKYGCESVAGAADKCSPPPDDGGEDGGDVTTDDDAGDSDDDGDDAGDSVTVYDDGGDETVGSNQQSDAPTATAASSGESGGCSAAPHSHENDSRSLWLVGLGAALMLVKRRRQS